MTCASKVRQLPPMPEGEQLTSFTAQMEYYTRRIADTEGWTMVKMYADKGISGTSAKRRPEFLKMIRDAEKGKIDLVIIKSVSRFCRNILDGLEYVRRLKKCGVGVYFEACQQAAKQDDGKISKEEEKH